MNTFLGYPSESVIRWIEEHRKPIPPPPFSNMFRFIAVNGDITISFSSEQWPEGYANRDFEYSTNGLEWTKWEYTGTEFLPLTVPDMQSLYIRGNNDVVIGPGPGDTCFKISGPGQAAAYGNIMYLLSYDGTKMHCPAQCFTGLFQNCAKLLTAPELPATSLDTQAYAWMFQNCTSLVKAPVIPAYIISSTNKSGELEGMFQGCTSLNYIEVDFETWIDEQYGGQFGWVQGVSPTGTFVCPQSLPQIFDASHIPSGWTVITKQDPSELAPLCFTALKPNVNIQMYVFDYWNWYDTDILMSEEFPEISFQYSYDNGTWNVLDMDDFCTNGITLQNVGDKVYFKAYNSNNGFFHRGEDPDAEDYYEYVAKFRITGDAASVSCSGNIQYLLDPFGERTDAPEGAFMQMFGEGCDPNSGEDINMVQLVSAPNLPAVALNDRCYEAMFSQSGLTCNPKLPAETLADGCYNGMFFGCTSLTSAPELPATQLANMCYAGMFQHCESLIHAPVLSAMTLAESCYENMFWDCTSMTAAPELPATQLADMCYEYMFNGCTEFSDCHMKASMQGVYNQSVHGDTRKTVIYDL